MRLNYNGYYIVCTLLLRDHLTMTQNLINCHVNEALDHIKQAEYGAHYIIIYPDLIRLRKLYSMYIHKQIEVNNEMILINPFYDMVLELT